jgi:GrpB-like predicted nucleotidyltransferase (UPF0157 family)
MTNPGLTRQRLGKITLVPHNPNWQYSFANEAERLTSILRQAVVTVEHVGSTSIPDIVAKPIVDILVEVTNLALVDEQTSAMELAGYITWGQNGIAGRRYFNRTQAGIRTHNIHIFPSGHPEISRMLTFCNYLRAHPADARAYEQLKQDLARQFPNDIDRYSESKGEFVNSILAKVQAA